MKSATINPWQVPGEFIWRIMLGGMKRSLLHSSSIAFEMCSLKQCVTRLWNGARSNVMLIVFRILSNLMISLASWLHMVRYNNPLCSAKKSFTAVLSSTIEPMYMQGNSVTDSNNLLLVWGKAELNFSSTSLRNAWLLRFPARIRRGMRSNLRTFSENIAARTTYFEDFPENPKSPDSSTKTWQLSMHGQSLAQLWINWMHADWLQP